MPFSLGPTEMVFIMVVLLLIFGAKRLPELGSGLGKGIREFRRSMHEIKGEVEREDPVEQIRAPSSRTSVPPKQEAEVDFNKKD